MDLFDRRGEAALAANRPGDPGPLDEEGGDPETDPSHLPAQLRFSTHRGESISRLHPEAARPFVDQHDRGCVRTPGPGGESGGRQPPGRSTVRNPRATKARQGAWDKGCAIIGEFYRS